MQKFRFIVRDPKGLRADLAFVEGPFGRYLRGRHSADRTIWFYHGVLRRAAYWLHQSGRRLSSLERKDVPAILRSLGLKWPRPARSALHGGLKFRGRFEMPRRTTRWQSWTKDYLHFMESDRGLSATCRSYYCRVADRYMAWQFHRRRIDWRLVRPQDVWRYAAKIHGKGWKVKSVIDELSGLRQFLRFVHVRGGCSLALQHAVPSCSVSRSAGRILS